MKYEKNDKDEIWGGEKKKKEKKLEKKTQIYLSTLKH